MTDEFPDSTPTIPVQPAVGEVSQQWRVVTSDGPLVIAQSSYEYAVYDQQHSYGRWPLTEDGSDVIYLVDMAEVSFDMGEVIIGA